MIAKKFNQEDGCKGHFWQDRFHSLKLEDRGAVLMAMSYVDLNPVRAGASLDLLRSHHTAISNRLRAGLSGQWSTPMDKALEGRAVRLSESLCPLEEIFAEVEWPVQEITLGEYVALLEDLGRLSREGKGCLQEETAQVLRRMGLNPESWEQILGFKRIYRHRAGSRQSLEEQAAAHGRSHYQGVGKASALYL
ncbi:MAG: hypothetical protein LR015_08140 [Verrucomicrobia bacterium]|nr:hypothetical protein [Verrucomicrobiota bacterium]